MRGRGRPRLHPELEEVIVRMATDNRGGYLRIRGALADLGRTVARTTIDDVPGQRGIEPAPERKTAWEQILKRRWAFDLDVLVCTRSSGQIRLVATIRERGVIRAIVEACGFPADSPVRAPAEPPPHESYWGAG